MSLAKYLKPFWGGIILILVLLFVQSLAELYLPTLMSAIVDDGIVYAYQTGESRMEFILQTGAAMLFFALLAGTFSIIVSYISPKVAAGAARDLRRDLFIKVENFSQTEFDKFSSASLITRCTNDVTQVQNVANISARMLLYAPILAVGGIFMALTRAPGLSWILGLAVIILFGIVILLVSIVMPKFALVQEKTDGLNRVAREILHGLPVIRAFAAQAHEKSRFDKSNTDLRDLGLFIGRTMAFIGPAITFIMGFTQVAIIFFGARSVGTLSEDLPIGDMMAFFQYSMQVLFAFMMFSMVLVMVPRAQVSAKRISEVLDTEFSIVDDEDLGGAAPVAWASSPPLGGRPAPNPPQGSKAPLTPTIVFEQVSFSYPNAEAAAVEGISFDAKAGETTAIIGATGAGKSTIAQLLLRFYDVSGGRILVDGVDIRRMRQAELREKIGYVPQKGQLLSGTIESNIKYGVRQAHGGHREDVSQATRSLEAGDKAGDNPSFLEKIARVAQAADFIAEKEGGFAAEISQGGTNISGGQRQRLSIARALAKEPEILIFDDAFSALDFQTDAALRKALREHAANAAIIVIAQRVGTIINAEQILVLDEGKIVGRGTHAELLKNCAEYREIASSQGAVS
ncbi:MAG: ABC transporter ATP-binding protein/permease [Defluviitaleaceae bacterium]|nr:ABC transporter ATP-binding protein/permease [Defluviitaleaceae bacterium]